MDQNYDVFGSVFGVRNYANFRPIAPERGIPGDSSEELKQIFGTSEEYSFSPSWITWSEIKTIDWEEEAEKEDSRLWIYDKGKGDEYVLTEKAGYSHSMLAQKLSLTEETIAASWKHGQVWEIEGRRYEVVRMKRKQALTRGWELLFQLMEVLATSSGDEGVRLVVWFN